MGVKAAEDYITHCHRCGREFRTCKTCTVKRCGECDIGLKIAAPKGKTSAFWFVCPRCLKELGGVYWTGKPPKITICNE